MTNLFPPRSWRRRLVITLAVVLLLYAAIGFLIIPRVARPQLETLLSEYARKPVKVGGVHFNPFALSVSVTDVAFDSGSEAPPITFEELYGDVRALSLLRMAVVLDSVHLQAPRVQLVLDKSGNLNLAALFASGEAPPEPPPAAAAPDEELFPIWISSATIDAGDLLFRDEQSTPPFEIELKPVVLELNDLTTRRDQSGSYILSAKTGENSTLDWRGTISIDPLRAGGEITLERIDARTLSQYLRQTLPFDVKGGTLGLKTEYVYDDSGETTHFVLGPADIAADALELRESNDSPPFLTLHQLHVTAAEIDFDRQRIKLGRLLSKKARITTWLDANGAMGPPALFGSPQAAPEPAAESSDQSWALAIGDIEIGDFGISFEDRSFAEPFVFTAEPIKANLDKLSFDAGETSKVNVEIGLPEAGTVKLTGTAGFSPLAVDLDVHADSVVLTRFQPYVGRSARIDLDGGSAAIDGKLKVRAEDGVTVVEYTGDASVKELVTSTPEGEEELVKWSSLALNGISFQSVPAQLHVTEAVLDQPYARIVITKEGTLNLGDLAVADAEGTAPPAEAAATAEEGPAITIDTLKITDGLTDFADYSIKPSVDTSIHKLTGQIDGLSSAPEAKSKLRLEGSVDKHAPVKISGTINPFNPLTQTDIVMKFDNVSLTLFTPYSARFAGYKIKKGKASVELKYHIENRKLVAENNVVLDKLTLGERVDGPDVTSLPVKLAVALLKDRNGRIDIALPMRGELDDPKFSYGSVLAKALVDLITKTVASPFSAIGALSKFDSEDLRSVEFAPGSSALDEEQAKKLDAIGEALKERPALRLEVTGAADPEADKVSLADTELTKELKRAKRSELKARGLPAPKKLSQIELTGDEYERLFTAKYKARFGATPPRDDQGGFTAAATSALAGSLTIEDSDLRKLAQKRAAAIQDRIAAAGIESERVYVIDVEIDAKSEGGKIHCELSLAS